MFAWLCTHPNVVRTGDRYLTSLMIVRQATRRGIHILLRDGHQHQGRTDKQEVSKRTDQCQYAV